MFYTLQIELKIYIVHLSVLTNLDNMYIFYLSKF